MATVKQMNRQAGKPAASNTTAVSSEVVATRGGEEMTFTRQIWDHLPPDKEGWEEIAGEPTINTSALTSNVTGNTLEGASKLTPRQAYNAAAKKYKELTGEAPAQNITTEDILAHIAQLEAAKDANAALDHAKAEYKDVLGEDAPEGSTIETLNAAIVAKKSEGGSE